ncbi:UNVERIFIED_CONTAM: hypothetical protein HDU68_012601 [Siphonaria sp. JEL0065]|nr:hypothetical protein HDU68_012601 [Siphonaria sp. JEL0065]
MPTILDHASSGDLTSIEKLTQEATDSEFEVLIQSRDFYDNNILHLACKHGHIDIISWILSKRISLINSRNLMGDTPLIVAASYNRNDAVSVLLGFSECQVNAGNDHGNTALHYAAFRRHKPILQLLINPTATTTTTATNSQESDKIYIHVRNKYGKTPLDRTSTEIRRDIAALVFMREGRVLGKEDAGNAIGIIQLLELSVSGGGIHALGVFSTVRTPQEIAEAQESVKLRFLESVIPDVEIPFPALNPSKPVLSLCQSGGGSGGSPNIEDKTQGEVGVGASAGPITKASKYQYMMGTWYNAPVVIQRLTNQMVHQSECRAIRREAEALRFLKHPTLSTIVGVSLQTPNVAYISEFISTKNLHSVIYDAEVEMDVDQVMTYAREIVSGLKYLHQQKPPVYHLNLNSKNVMITENNQNIEIKSSIKLTEYGHQDSIFRTWSTILELQQKLEQEGGNITNTESDANSSEIDGIDIEYIAPELLDSEKQNMFSINEFGAIDVYAFGVLFLEIIVRDRVYPGMSGREVSEAVGREGYEGPEIPDFVPPELQVILQGCFKRNPAERMGIEEIEGLLNRVE